MPSEINKVCIVIPCYRSEKTIAKVVGLCRDELIDGGYSPSFVLVNDASPDGTYEVIQRLCEEHDDVTGIDLARNFGQHGAVLCGLNYAEGDCVVLMDDDMQTHPSQVRILLRRLEQDDCDVVFASYPDRSEAAWRQLGSRFWQWTIRVMTGCPSGVEMTSFTAMRMWVARELANYTGPFPVIQGLIFRTTKHVVNAEVQHFDRESGSSGYTLKALLKLWANALNFSMAPLRMSMFLGGILGLIGIVAAIVVVIRRLTYPEVPVGWSSLMAALSMCSGLILMALGVIGEYVGRIFLTSNGTPQYVVRRISNGGEVR